MTARIDAAELTPELAKKLGLTNATRKRAAADGDARSADDTNPASGAAVSMVPTATTSDRTPPRGGPHRAGTGPAGRAPSQPRKRARPSRAAATEGQGTWRCHTCHTCHATWGAAERHARTIGHARIDIVIPEGDRQ